MKEGKSLTDLAIELDRQVNAKHDYVADTRCLSMHSGSDRVILQMDTENQDFKPSRSAHSQIAQWANIPQAYYDRMPQDLKATNVNHWLQQSPAKRMVRTMDGQMRAFLSDRYRILDNYDLAQSILPVLQEVQDMKIISCELTERRMYIKALFPRIEDEVQVGDTVQSGVVISNSEIGQGSLRVEPLVYRLVCLNGMISNYSQKRYHIGKAAGVEEQARELFRDETLQADDKAFWMKVQDTVRASVNEASFKNIVASMRETMGLEMKDSPVEVVKRVQKSFGFNEQEGNGVLQHLIQGADLSAYGLLNAITRTSQDVEDYDRATELERIGGKVLELNQEQWKVLSEAA